MAYNNQQPFWDFVQTFSNSNNNGAGVDHPAEGAFPFAHPGANPPPFPPPPGFGGPFGPTFCGGFGGFGGPRHRGGFRGRRGRFDRREGSHERAGSRHSVHDHSDNEAREPREGSPHGHAHEHDHEHEHEHEHHGPHRGPGRHGRRGGWGGGWGGARHHHRGGPPPYPGGPGFDFSGFMESLSSHPLAQAFRSFAEQAGQQSGETKAQDTDADDTFTPPIDIFSTPSAYILHVALPGAKKGDIGVNWDAEKGVLNLAGVVYRKGDEEFLKTLSQSERKVGVFERTVKLPPGEAEKEEVDGDMITAKLEDGVLIVTVPKVEKEWTEVKRVDIE